MPIKRQIKKKTTPAKKVNPQKKVEEDKEERLEVEAIQESMFDQQIRKELDHPPNEFDEDFEIEDEETSDEEVEADDEYLYDEQEEVDLDNGEGEQALPLFVSSNPTPVEVPEPTSRVDECLEQIDNIPEWIKSIPISLLDNVADTKPKPETYEYMLRAQVANEKVRKQINELRDTLDPEERDRRKKKLPCYVLATFKAIKDGDRSKTGVSSEFVASSQLMQYDIDKQNPAQLSRTYKALSDGQTIPEVHVCFLSPSGNGLRFIVVLDKPITDAQEYSALYESLREKYSRILGVECDKVGNINRKWYISHDVC